MINFLYFNYYQKKIDIIYKMANNNIFLNARDTFENYNVPEGIEENYVLDNLDSIIDVSFENLKANQIKNEKDLNIIKILIKRNLKLNFKKFLNDTFLTEISDTIHKKVKSIKDDFIKNENEGNGIKKTNTKYTKTLEKLDELQKIVEEYNNEPVKTYTINDEGKKEEKVSIKEENYNPEQKSNVYAENRINSLKTLNNVPIYSLRGENSKYLNEEPSNIEDIQKRVDNCWVLENLYLQKHEELYTVFRFALTLFDKYKISTELLVYLIKNLVQYEVSDINIPNNKMDINIKPKPETTIKLPKTVIRDIAALVRDQKKIQTVISDMKENIDNIHSFKNQNIPREPPSGSTPITPPTSGSSSGSATPFKNPKMIPGGPRTYNKT